MGDPRGSPVEGADRAADGLTPNTILEPVILRFAVLTYLVVLPVGHLVAMPVNGAMAVGSDVFLALVLLAGIIELGRMSGPYLAGRVEKLPLLPGVAPSIWRRSFSCPLAFGWHSVRLGVPIRATP